MYLKTEREGPLLLFFFKKKVRLADEIIWAKTHKKKVRARLKNTKTLLRGIMHLKILTLLLVVTRSI